MVQGFHYSDFSEQFLKTSRVQLCLINDLDSDLLARWDVFGQLDLGEVPLANGLEESVLPNVRFLPCAASRNSGAWLPLKE